MSIKQIKRLKRYVKKQQIIMFDDLLETLFKMKLKARVMFSLRLIFKVKS